MTDLLQELRSLGEDPPEDTGDGGQGGAPAAPAPAPGQTQASPSAKSEPSQTASDLQDAGHFDSFISGLGARKALGNDSAFLTSKRNEAETDVSTWEKELAYKQDLLADPAQAGKPLPFLQADVTIAQRKLEDAKLRFEDYRKSDVEAWRQKATPIGNVANQLVKGGMAGITDLGMSLVQHGESTGQDYISEVGRGIADAAKSFSATIPENAVNLGEVKGVGSAVEFGTGAVGQAFGYMGPALASGPAALPIFWSQGVGAMRGALEDAGVTDKDTLARASYTYGTLVGTLQAAAPWAAMRNWSGPAQEAFAGTLGQIAAKAATGTLKMSAVNAVAAELATVATRYGVSDATGKPITTAELLDGWKGTAIEGAVAGVGFGLHGEAGKALHGGYRVGTVERPGAEASPAGEAPPQTLEGQVQADQLSELRSLGEPTPQEQLQAERSDLATVRTPEAESRKVEIERQLSEDQAFLDEQTGKPVQATGEPAATEGAVTRPEDQGQVRSAETLFAGPVTSAIRAAPVANGLEFRETTHVDTIAHDSAPNWDVYKDGQKVGDFWLAENANSVGVMPRVEEAFRRQGIATAIHDAVATYAEQNGKTLKVPSEADLTPDGKAFWQARAPEATLRTPEEIARLDAIVEQNLPAYHADMQQWSADNGFKFDLPDDGVRAVARHMADGLPVEEALTRYAQEGYEAERQKFEGQATAEGAAANVAVDRQAAPAGGQATAPVGKEGGRPGAAAGTTEPGQPARGLGAQGQQGSAADRASFRALLNGTTARKDWGKSLGVDPRTLESLIRDAEGEGLLRVDRNGVVRRTALARSTEAGPTSIVPSRRVMPAVLAVPPDVVLDRAVAAREAKTGNPVSPSVTQYATRLQETVSDKTTFDSLLRDLKKEAWAKRDEVLDLAAVMGVKVNSRTTKAEALAGLEALSADVEQQTSNIMAAVLDGRLEPAIETRELDERGMYSPSLEAAKKIPQATGTVQQMRAQLLSAGAKPKELEAVGFDKAFPDPNAKVSRAQIEEFLRGNRVGFGQTSYAGHAEDTLIPRAGEPRFENWSTPGGIPGSYREVVVTLPSEAKTLDQISREKGYGGWGSHLTAEQRAEVDAAQTSKPTDQYTSSHWPGVTNPLLHYRVKDFLSREGTAPANVDGQNKIRVLDEIQSDWAQRARDQGTRDPALSAELEKKMKTLREARAAGDKEVAQLAKDAGGDFFRDLHRNGVSELGTAERIRRTHTDEAIKGRAAELMTKLSAIENDLMDAQNKWTAAEHGVPSAPFISNTSDWVDLGLKQALVDAVRDPSVTRFAWAPGKVQADRYNLSQRVEQISYKPNPDGTIRLWALPKGHPNANKIGDFEPSKLNDVVGAELADRIRAGDGKVSGFHGEDRGTKTISDLGIKIGGEGMKSFYGDFTPDGSFSPGIVGTRLLKLVRAIDPSVKIEPTDLSQEGITAVERARGYGKVDTISDRYPSIPITPELRDALLRGTPMFAIRGFHGSPHDFDKFDSTHIGKGEGAQAYGFGLYFAESEGVAKHYREKLAPQADAQNLYKEADVTLDGKPIKASDFKSEWLREGVEELEGYASFKQMRRIIGDNQNTEDALAELKPLVESGRLKWAPPTNVITLNDKPLSRTQSRDFGYDLVLAKGDLAATKARILEKAKMWNDMVGFAWPWNKAKKADNEKARKHTAEYEALAVSVQKLIDDGVVVKMPMADQSRLYQVSINAEAEQFLDWDKPLGEQSPLVQAAVQRLGVPVEATTKGAVIQDKLGKTGRERASRLRDVGVVGIRYLNGMSRDKGEGKYNYVIFPENEGLIEIVAKDGKPLNSAEKNAILAAMGVEPSVKMVGDDIGTRRSLSDEISAGRTVTVEQGVKQAVHDAVRPYAHIVPKGTDVGALHSVEPTGKAGEVRAHFETADGSRFDIVLPLSRFRTLRAFATTDGRSIGFTRYGTFSGFAHTLAGELHHEVVHTIRARGGLNGGDFARLVAHADFLTLLDTELGTYLHSIGDPAWIQIPAGETVRQAYTDLYHTQPDFQRRMDEESVAHLNELYKHAQLRPSSDPNLSLRLEDVAPVKDILDRINSGDASRQPAPLPKDMSQKSLLEFMQSTSTMTPEDHRAALSWLDKEQAKRSEQGAKIAKRCLSLPAGFSIAS